MVAASKVAPARQAPWSHAERNNLSEIDLEALRCDRSSAGARETTHSSGLNPEVDTNIDWWDESRYELQNVLRLSSQLRYRVDIYRDTVADKSVAVKRFEASAMDDSLAVASFKEGENPILELKAAEWSAKAGAMCVCPVVGLFRNKNVDGEVLFVTDWTPQGDLLSYCRTLMSPGLEREARVMQVLASLVSSVVSLHEHGTAHGNLSVESARLRWPNQRGHPEVLLSDLTHFKQGADALSARGPSGQAAYVAPEAHSSETHSAFAADFWAVGIIAYSMATGAHPWLSTAPGADKAYAYFVANGLEAFLEKRMVTMAGRRAADCMSWRLVSTLQLLLSSDPSQRADAVAFLM